jgi:hypothetical protein
VAYEDELDRLRVEFDLNEAARVLDFARLRTMSTGALIDKIFESWEVGNSAAIAALKEH